MLTKVAIITALALLGSGAITLLVSPIAALGLITIAACLLFPAMLASAT